MRFVATAVLAAVLAAPAAQATPARAPVLRLVDLAPVAFRGSGFLPRERVVVTLTRNTRTLRRSAAAGSGGAFRVSFGLVALDACRGAIVVRATGARGSLATYRRRCLAPRP